MNQETNDMLYSDIMEAKCMFDNLIMEMQEMGISFPYDDVIKMTETSYANTYNAITRMNESLKNYEYLKEANEGFFDDEAKLVISGILMYIISLTVMRIFRKILSSNQINEIYYMIVGFILGSVNTGIVYSNINNHRYGDKDSREFINQLKSLKEDYKKDYHLAYSEIESICALNRNLQREIDNNIRKLSI